MRGFSFHTLAALLVVMPGRMHDPLISQPKSRLWVEGASTLRAFECTTPGLAIAVDAEGSGATRAVLEAKQVVRAVTLTIPVAGIECGSGTMNEHMRTALKADEAPIIRFKLLTYETTRTSDGADGMMHGTLTLGGAQHPVDVAATATSGGEGLLRIAGSYELAMSSFDLTPPSLMFGRIKVRDKVRVRFDIVLKS